MSANLPEMILYAGEVNDWGVTVTDSDDAAFDLTGSTIHFTAKKDLKNADSDALIDVSQATHTNAAGGLSTLPIDLSSVADHIKANGICLEGDMWLEDSSGNKIPQGLIIVTVKPAATRTFT